jgi:hypothetical protein
MRRDSWSAWLAMLLISLSVPVWAQDAEPETGPLSGLRELGQALDTIREKGVDALDELVTTDPNAGRSHLENQSQGLPTYIRIEKPGYSESNGLNAETLSDRLREATPQSVRDLSDNVSNLADESVAGIKGLLEEMQAYSSNNTSAGEQANTREQNTIGDSQRNAGLVGSSSPLNDFTNEINLLERELGIPASPSQPQTSAGLSDLSAYLGNGNDAAETPASDNWSETLQEAEIATVQWKAQEAERQQQEAARAAEERRLLAEQEAREVERQRQQAVYLERRRQEIGAEVAERKRMEAARTQAPSVTNAFTALFGGILQGAAAAYIERESGQSRGAAPCGEFFDDSVCSPEGSAAGRAAEQEALRSRSSIRDAR